MLAKITIKSQLCLQLLFVFTEVTVQALPVLLQDYNAAEPTTCLSPEHSGGVRVGRGGSLAYKKIFSKGNKPHREKQFLSLVIAQLQGAHILETSIPICAILKKS